METMRRRTILSVLAVAGTAVAIPVGGASPAGAQIAGSTVVVGNFAGTSGAEVFIYDPADVGGPNDQLLTFDRDQPGGTVTVSGFLHDMGPGYVPLAGDYDGDGYDEITWYGPGSLPDVRWDFTDFDAHTDTPLTVSGANYRPATGDFTGDGVDDIFWYAPGAGTDSLWDYNSGGGFTSAVRAQGGDYRPLVASVGKDNTDDILWYAPGSTADPLWDWTLGTTLYNIKSFTVSGTYRAFTLDMFGDGWRGDDFYWYAPGPGTDTFWDYILGVREFSYTDPVSGDHVPAAGDFFADGEDDIFWLNDNAPVLWEHSDFNRWTYVFDSSSAANSLGVEPESGVAPVAQQSIER
jgi:hypothetical protein